MSPNEGEREWVDFCLDRPGETGGENKGVWTDTRGRERSLSELKTEQTLLTGISMHRWARLQLNQHQILSPQTRYTHTANPTETPFYTTYHIHIQPICVLTRFDRLEASSFPNISW